MTHNNLPMAKKAKDDEFYTLLEDIGREVVKYLHLLQGKVVYCNCDDKNSAFLYFFMTYFHLFGLKKLYCSGLSGDCVEYNGFRARKRMIDGDFRSAECRTILEASDLVITNPPFSIFRVWLSIVGQKDSLVIGNKNAVAYKELFPMIQSGRVRLGYTIPNKFYSANGDLTDKLDGLCRWFTTLNVDEKPTWKPTLLYNEGNYQRFDHYPAINVDEVRNIPADYKDLMGVPITYLDHIDYRNYEIIDLISRYAVMDKSFGIKGHQLTEINGKPKYSRLIIKKV